MKGRLSYDSNFAWWGERDYVHGSHMIYQLLDALEAWGCHDVENIIASFRFKLLEQGTYLLLSESVTKNKNYCATFKVESHGSLYSVALIGNGESVKNVLPDDEIELIANCTVNKKKKSASMKNFSDSKFINVYIALNKHLLYEIIDSEGYEPWYMAQLSLHLKYINTVHSKDLTIRLENIIGDRMTKSSIEIDSNKIGEIFFSRKPIA